LPSLSAPVSAKGRGKKVARNKYIRIFQLNKIADQMNARFSHSTNSTGVPKNSGGVTGKKISSESFEKKNKRKKF